MIGGMINDQLGDDPQSALMRGVEKRLKIFERSVVRVDVEIIGDVVAVVAQWRWIKGQEPDGGDAELLEIIEFLDQPPKIANPIAVAVMKCFDMQLINDRVFVPKRIGR